MLTQLTTVKARLVIPDIDTQYDTLLTNAIRAVSAQFDRECNRTLARSVDAAQEFDADETEVPVKCYPIETVSRFETKSSEAEGWVEQTGVDYLVRKNCIISLSSALGTGPLPLAASVARVIYTGGYVLPGTTPESGQVALPDDLEQAAVEQVAYWFQNRDRLGLVRIWEYHATYRHFLDLDLLRNVRAVLRQYERWVV